MKRVGILRGTKIVSMTETGDETGIEEIGRETMTGIVTERKTGNGKGKEREVGVGRGTEREGEAGAGLFLYMVYVNVATITVI